MLTFLMGFAAERYVEKKYALPHAAGKNSGKPGRARIDSIDAAAERYDITNDHSAHSHQGLHSGDQNEQVPIPLDNVPRKDVISEEGEEYDSIEVAKDKAAEVAFRQQIAAFLILEFGVIFHSVIIGLTLGTAGEEFATLYPVIVFHQAFEGLGIGARLSAIPFPRRLRWMPWVLCLAYGLTTPIAIAIALGLRTTYNAGSFTANVVSGVLDSTSAGILIYTGFVELLARDFLFNPDRKSQPMNIVQNILLTHVFPLGTDDDKQLGFMILSILLGAGIMALLGKWA
jgi:solute carrier family 39 (zinc transporter), member 1/2/3